MENATKTIAVVRGASNAAIQGIFLELVEKWHRDVRLAGVVATVCSLVLECYSVWSPMHHEKLLGIGVT